MSRRIMADFFCNEFQLVLYPPSPASTDRWAPQATLERQPGKRTGSRCSRVCAFEHVMQVHDIPPVFVRCAASGDDCPVEAHRAKTGIILRIPSFGSASHARVVQKRTVP